MRAPQRGARRNGGGRGARATPRDAAARMPRVTARSELRFQSARFVGRNFSQTAKPYRQVAIAPVTARGPSIDPSFANGTQPKYQTFESERGASRSRVSKGRARFEDARHVDIDDARVDGVDGELVDDASGGVRATRQRSDRISRGCPSRPSRSRGSGTREAGAPTARLRRDVRARRRGRRRRIERRERATTTQDLQRERRCVPTRGARALTLHSNVRQPGAYLPRFYHVARGRRADAQRAERRRVRPRPHLSSRARDGSARRATRARRASPGNPHLDPPSIRVSASGFPGKRQKLAHKRHASEIFPGHDASTLSVLTFSPFQKNGKQCTSSRTSPP